MEDAGKINWRVVARKRDYYCTTSANLWNLPHFSTTLYRRLNIYGRTTRIGGLEEFAIDRAKPDRSNSEKPVDTA
jgi:hypothetical protein